LISALYSGLDADCKSKEELSAALNESKALLPELKNDFKKAFGFLVYLNRSVMLLE